MLRKVLHLIDSEQTKATNRYTIRDALKDLSASKAQIELERGEKQPKERIIDYITEMLNVIPNDKEIKIISLADNDKAIDELKVQPFSSLVPEAGLEPARCLHRRILSPNTNQKTQYVVEITKSNSLYIVPF